MQNNRIISKLVPDRLSQARKASLLNMTELGRQTGLTRQAISQFENKKAQPSPENLRRIAHTLGTSEAYLTWPLSSIEEAERSVATFRSMKSSLERARQQAITWLEWFAASTDVLSKYVEFPSTNLPDFQIGDVEDLDEDGVIENYAEKTRQHFGLGEGPISNLTLLMEKSGVFVTFKKLEREISGLSIWFGSSPFIIIDSKNSAVRARFSLAHELGHLVLHRGLICESDLQNKDFISQIERQADLFAGAFLLPERSFSSEVYSTNWSALITLKDRWKVAIAAIIMRLSQLELINSSQKTRLFQTMNMKKARIKEPLDDQIQIEKPRLISKVAALLESESILGTEQICDSVKPPKETMAELLGIPLERLQAQDSFGNVVSLRTLT